MSATEHDTPPTSEAASSVKLTRNAKGETQIEVKAYATDDMLTLRVVAANAQTIYDELAGKYGVAA